MAERENFMTFQDWVLAIYEAYSKENTPFAVDFVTDEDLTDDKIGKIEVTSVITPDDLTDNRQSENITEAWIDWKRSKS